jgi:putative nucleotidyltransferase with HDIG domain
VSERPSQGGLRWQRPGRFLRDLNIIALLCVIAAAGALLLLPISDDGLLGLPQLEVGDLSPRTIKSPQAFVVPNLDATEQQRRAVVRKIRPVYDQRVWLGEDAKRRLEDAFDEGRRHKDDPEETIEERARLFMLGLGVAVDEEALTPLLAAGNQEELRDATIMVVQTIYEQRIVEDKRFLDLQNPARGFTLRMVNEDGEIARTESFFNLGSTLGLDQARSEIDALVSKELSRLEPKYRRGVAQLAKKLLRPNLVPNQAETNRQKLDAERSVKTVSISIAPGETVLREGERVSKQDLQILQGIEKELRAQSRLQAAIGSALLVVLLVGFAYRYASRSFLPAKPSHRDLTFMATAFIVMMLVFWAGYKLALPLAEALPVAKPTDFRFVVPVALGALAVRLIVGWEAALAFTAVMGVIAGWMMDTSLGYAAYTIAGSLAAASVPDHTTWRVAILRASTRAGLTQASLLAALLLIESSWSMEALLSQLMLAGLSAASCLVLAFICLPVVEVMFGYTTSFRLADLSNLNHPLLRDLLVEAPGTYHHSIMVGTLAQEAANAIGANAQLALVGGYYHDVGKIKNPEAFEENERQAFGSLPPLDEARELKMHVADGLELGAKHRLGAPVLEIIAQHHGTGVVRNAHQRAAEQYGNVDRADFAYAGPRPLSRESAIVMLADTVEVATRDLAQEIGLVRETIEQRVRQALGEVLEDRQLEQCELTLRDISAVSTAFTNVLEDRLLRRGRPPTLSSLPVVSGATMVRAPGGEPN